METRLKNISISKQADRSLTTGFSGLKRSRDFPRNMPRTFLPVPAHLKNFRIFTPGIIPTVSIAFSMKIANELTRAVLFVPHTATPSPVVWHVRSRLTFSHHPPPLQFPAFFSDDGYWLKAEKVSVSKRSFRNRVNRV